VQQQVFGTGTILFAIVSGICTGGITTADTSPGMADPVQLCSIITMRVGRLGVIPVIALIAERYGDDYHCGAFFWDHPRTPQKLR